MDISLPFSLEWVAACCQDTTSFIICAFREQGGMALNYIYDFGGTAGNRDMATLHFHMLQTVLWRGALALRRQPTRLPLQLRL